METLPWCLLWLVCFAALPKDARAQELLRWFDLDRSSVGAANIYLGFLHRDGTFGATKVLKGPLELPVNFEIEQGKHWVTTYSKMMGVETDPEIIAFVENPPVVETKRIGPVSIGSVGVSPKGKIFGFFPDGGSMTGSRLREHEVWTRELFLHQLEQSIAAGNRLNVILAMPPSTTRVGTLLDFLKSDLPRLKAQHETRVEAKAYGRGSLFYRAAAGLKILASEEETFLAGLLQQPQPDEDLTRLLTVVARVQKSDLLYRCVLPYAEPDRPGVVRREAFSALVALDPYAAAGDFAKFLTLDEPELRPVLMNLSICAQTRDPRLLNSAVLEPLRKLGPLILEESHDSLRNDNGNRLSFLIGALDCYHHPSNLSLLMGAADDEPLSPGRPTSSQFRTMTALGHNPEEGGQLPAWWAKNRELLQQVYDLRTSQGFKAWLKAFDGTDGTWTRGILLRLWAFEPVIPESELLRGCHGQYANAAKALLSELWRQKRISAETRKKLVATFLKMRIQENPSPFPKTPAWRELTVECDTDFPFPESAAIVFTGGLACGRVPVITNPKSGGSTFLASAKTRSLQSLGGTVEGPAKALIELWEKDYTADPSRELWRLRWKLDQTQNAPRSPVPSEAK